MATLRADQIEGVEAAERGLSTYKGFLLGDFMGLGKTAQAIELLKRYRVRYPELPVIVISPAYLVRVWLAEFELWEVKESVCVIDSTAQVLHDAGVYVSSYNMAVSKNILKQLLKKKTSLVICDEGHALKGWNTLRSRYILGTFANKKSNLAYNTKSILLLTGTPLVNDITDIYHIFYRIAPQIFENMTKGVFLSTFAAELISSPWGLKIKGVKNVEQLQKMLSPVYIARSITGTLPPLVKKYIPLTVKGVALEKLLKEENEFLKAHGVSEGDILDAQKMKSDENFARRRCQIAIYKIPLILPAVLDSYADGNKPIVYFWHRQAIEVFVEALQKKQKNAVIRVIHGGINTKDRHEIVKAYQAGEVDYLVASIGSLREGVTLTHGTHVIFCELPLTPAELSQVCARLHRTGQTQPVLATLFHFSQGVDKHILGILKDKSDIIDKVIQVKQVGLLYGSNVKNA